MYPGKWITKSSTKVFGTPQVKSSLYKESNLTEKCPFLDKIASATADTCVDSQEFSQLREKKDELITLSPPNRSLYWLPTLCRLVNETYPGVCKSCQPFLETLNPINPSDDVSKLTFTSLSTPKNAALRAYQQDPITLKLKPTKSPKSDLSDLTNPYDITKNKTKTTLKTTLKSNESTSNQTSKGDAFKAHCQDSIVSLRLIELVNPRSLKSNATKPTYFNPTKTTLNKSPLLLPPQDQ